MEFTPETPPFGAAIKFYRPQVACTVQNVFSEKGQHPVLNIEMALCEKGKPHWDNKTVVQITIEELPRVCGCALRIISYVEYRYHGEHKNRGYSLHWSNEGNLVIAVFSPAGKLYMNLTPEETFRLTDFILNRTHQGVSTMSKTDLMNLLHRTFRN